MISIIVPVYNAEKYLSDCITSILNQTYKDFQLILVNDGSIDKSLDICKTYRDSDHRILVAEQQNSGVSAARNYGLSIAKGEYIFFVDADDKLENTALEDLINVALNNASDIVIGGFRVEGRRVVNDTEVLDEYKGNVNKSQLLKLMVSMNKKRIRENVWRCLFAKSLLDENEIHFRVGMKIAEDYLFFLQAVDCAEKIYILPKELYVYYANTCSVTSRYIDSLHMDMEYVDEWIKDNLCNKYPEIKAGYFERLVNTYLRSIQNLCLPNSPYSIKDRIKELKRFSENRNYKLALKNVRASKKIFSNVDRLSIKFLKMHLLRSYVILYTIYKKIRK